MCSPTIHTVCEDKNVGKGDWSWQKDEDISKALIVFPGAQCGLANYKIWDVWSRQDFGQTEKTTKEKQQNETNCLLKQKKNRKEEVEGENYTPDWSQCGDNCQDVITLHDSVCLRICQKKKKKINLWFLVMFFGLHPLLPSLLSLSSCMFCLRLSSFPPDIQAHFPLFSLRQVMICHVSDRCFCQPAYRRSICYSDDSESWAATTPQIH